MIAVSKSGLLTGIAVTYSAVFCVDWHTEQSPCWHPA